MILSIETATELCGVALVDKQVCIAQRTVVEKNIHSERLMVLVDEVLREANVAVGALDGIAVSAGPGSFTGLRIGMSAAKGLAYSRSVRLLAVPTLDAIAYEALQIDRQMAEAPGVVSAMRTDFICAAVDAKRDEAYYAFYEPQAGTSVDGILTQGDDVRCISRHAIARVSEIAAQLPRNRRVFLAGDGAHKIAAALTGMVEYAPHPIVLCSPAAVGLLAERRTVLYTVGDYTELEPVYIRDFVTTMPRVANQTTIP
jgi:tRNA threonylcarbamoyladenosine biosynthesis protein TsaB